MVMIIKNAMLKVAKIRIIVVIIVGCFGLLTSYVKTQIRPNICKSILMKLKGFISSQAKGSKYTHMKKLLNKQKYREQKGKKTSTHSNLPGDVWGIKRCPNDLKFCR